MNRIAIVYGSGAATPTEIIRSICGRWETIIVSPRELPESQVFAGACEVIQLDLPPSQSALAKLRERGLSGITTFSESLLESTALLAQQLCLTYHPPATAAVLRDKREQRALLNRAACSAVRSFDLSWSAGSTPLVPAEVVWPVVMKPALGEGSRDTYMIQDGLALEKAIAEIARGLGGGQFVLEELIQGTRRGTVGDYVSVETAVMEGEIRHFGLTGKLPLVPPFRETCSFWPASLNREEALSVLALTSRAISAIGIESGLVHTEIKLSPHGPQVIEVNGRLGGFVADLARRGRGLDCLELAVEISVGDSTAFRALQSLEVDIDRFLARDVVFVFNNLPPEGGGVFLGLEGAQSVRNLDGISSFNCLAVPGQLFPASTATVELDLLRGRASSIAVMLLSIRQAVDRLTYHFHLPDQAAPVTIPAGALPSACSIGVTGRST